MKPSTDPAIQQLRVPPYSQEAEEAVLGILLIDNLAYERIATMIGEKSFYMYPHQIIWKHMANLIRLNRPADVVTVKDALELAQELEAVGGAEYLDSLAHSVLSSANVERYAEIIMERALLRGLLAAGEEIVHMSLDSQGEDARQIIDRAESVVLHVAEQGAAKRTEFCDMKQLSVEVVNEIMALSKRENKSDVTGRSTGFLDLDRKTSGLHGGELIIVAGRPSMGKTTFSMNIAEHIALNENLPVVVFSMEMSGAQLVLRMAGSVGEIDQEKLRKGDLNAQDVKQFVATMDRLSGAPVFIDETPGLNPIELRARAKRLARQVSPNGDIRGSIGLIVVDYLQLMSGAGARSSENRATEVSEISRSLKQLARELDCPVIALSQLNRQLEQRQDKRPVMSDLRESGAIEQDADVILFIYRDEVYHPDTAEKGKAEVIIGKQRNGPIGKVFLTFKGMFTRFYNYANPDFYGDAPPPPPGM